MAMSLNELKAKYGKKETVSTTAASITKATAGAAAKTWNATKSAAVTTGSYVKDVAPATNRRVNSIAAELNAKYNNHEKELFKHQVMIEMIAQATGVNLPEDEVLEEYYAHHLKEQEEAAKQQSQTVTETDVESIAQQVMNHVLSAFKKQGYVPEEEETTNNEESVNTDDEVNMDTTPEPESNRNQTAADKFNETMDEEQPQPRKRRRLGRQAPLAE